MESAYRRCCGIDVHKKSVSVCVLPPMGHRGIEVKHEKFRTFTRDLKRLRAWLVRCKVTEVVMESTGQYWRPVASDLFCESGRRMLAALASGDRDPGWMADYARGSLRGKKYQLELALEGTFTAHQRGVLARLLEQMQGLEQRIAELTAEIECRVGPYEDALRRIDTVPGLDRISAWTVLAEIGTDMSVFEDARHLASWAAVCPGVRESGGKRMSGKTRKGNVYLRRVLCQSAWAAIRKKDSHLAGLFRRIRAHRGEQKAIMAVAHQLLTILFHVLRDGGVYQELGASYYEQKNKPKITRRLIERLQKLGYYVTLQPVQAALESLAAIPATAASPTAPPLPRPRGRPSSCAERDQPPTHPRSVAPPSLENPPCSSGDPIASL